ncbi:glycosyltransferase family 4 protein [Mucilaginibacter lutimaris]|uniref:Glycosyltransferase family 4 protein n=1 Tax=Mucilaginibacter lutimaris TaxID=931629 RepID=A0ABW2ZGW4_9SPHI
MQKLAIIITHPIQYYAPVFKLLQERQNILINVFYTWGEAAQHKFDPGFGKNISWDIPLLDGYPYEWVHNIASDPGSHHAKGIDNPGLIEQVLHWQPDAILIYGWFYKSHLKAIRYFKGKVPVIFRGDSTLLDDSGGLRSVVRSFFLRWVYSKVDHALYTGTNNKRYFKKFGLKEARLTFAPHAVDNDRFAAARDNEAEALRTQLGIGKNEILILFAGKFQPKKAPDLLLTAFTELRIPGAHLLFTGNGVLENELKNKATGHKNIHFTEFKNQNDMPVIYQACDLFCLPSKGPGETWGLAVNEAMACGKAIIVSNKSGCAVDLVKPGLNGYIFDIGQPAMLREYLFELASSKSSLQGFGEQSRIIIKDWNFTKIAAAIEDVVVSYNCHL